MLEVNFNFGAAGDNYYFWMEYYKQSSPHSDFNKKNYFLTLLNTFYHKIQHLSI